MIIETRGHTGMAIVGAGLVPTLWTPHDRMGGDRKQGDHKQGDHKQGDHKQGDHKQGDHKQGDHKQGDHKGRPYRAARCHTYPIYLCNARSPVCFFCFSALDKDTFPVYNVIRLYQCASSDTKEGDDRSQFTHSDLLSAHVLFQRAD